MGYRVYDDRTNETLFNADESFECVLYIKENFDEDDDYEEFTHIWIGKEE